MGKMDWGECIVFFEVSLSFCFRLSAFGSKFKASYFGKISDWKRNLKGETMNDFYIALLIGVIAGIIDVIPMLIQKLDKNALLSAFIHWVGLGLIIPYVNWNIQPWFKGILIALLTALPIMIIIYPKDKKALIPITILSIILGAGIGFASARFIG